MRRTLVLWEVKQLLPKRRSVRKVFHEDTNHGGGNEPRRRKYYPLITTGQPDGQLLKLNNKLKHLKNFDGQHQRATYWQYRKNQQTNVIKK